MEREWAEVSDDSEPAQVSVQNVTPVALPQAESALRALPEFVLLREGGRSVGAVAIILTSDEHLSHLHAEHLGDVSLTDIMTFPYSTSATVVSADIVISVERAMEQAVDAGWSLDEEIQFIAIHGMLHLCGWDDHDEASRDLMHRRQHEILEAFSHDHDLIP
ncbi:MAG: rRNA maturation RNase YbeY [Thermomicrobiales bacterium]